MVDCSRQIIAEDIYDYIVVNIPIIHDILDNSPDICVEEVDEQWMIVHSRLPDNRELNISSLGYYTIPKIYGLMDNISDGYDTSGLQEKPSYKEVSLCDSDSSNTAVDGIRADISSIEASGAVQIINQPYLNARGQGVIIGVIDTGIDYLRNNFRDSSGNTRILAIWDQTLEYSTSQMVSYGRVYESTDINRALRAYDNGEDPYVYVASKDTIGHGTFMAGIAASGETDGYTGIAPEADIICVKLKGAKQYLKDFFYVNDKVEAFSETDIMLAVKFLKDCADKYKKPLVIYIGSGSGSGSRTGATPLADVLDAYTKISNTCVVVPAGNEAIDRTHYSGYADVAPEGTTMEINVEKRGRGFVTEIWAKSLDVLSISIISPTGEIIPRIPARIGMSSEYAFLLENSRVYVDYQITESVAGQEIIFLRFESPAEGLWKVLIYSLTNLPGYFNAWMLPSQLMDSTAYFISSDSDVTLTEPACASRVITIGAYNHNTGGADINSSRGYTADNRIKPDIAAPGVNVYGVGGVRGYTRRSGTSVAAAHAAGAAALFLSWGVTAGNRDVIGNTEIKSYLIRGAARDNSREYPDVAFGYGKLNIYSAFDQMRIN